MLRLRPRRRDLDEDILLPKDSPSLIVCLFADTKQLQVILVVYPAIALVNSRGVWGKQVGVYLVAKLCGESQEFRKSHRIGRLFSREDAL